MNNFENNFNRFNNAQKDNKLGVEQKFETRKSIILENLEDYQTLPEENLEVKMDYFFSPYNSRLHYQKHMNFDDVNKQDSSLTVEEKVADIWSKVCLSQIVLLITLLLFVAD